MKKFLAMFTLLIQIHLDYSLSNKQSTSEFTGNAEDGLLEVDQYGNLISSLAKDWSVSKDGLTYTYKLRKGVKMGNR